MTARVLVIEGNQDLGETLSEVLALEGYEVHTTTSAPEGVAMAAREAWDVILLDVELPRPSGWAIQSVLRDLGRSNVVLMSGLPDPWEAAAFAAGATACLRKPLSAPQVLALVRALVAGGRWAAEWPGDVRRLGPEDVARIVAQPPEVRGRLPFGVIRLNEEGIITEFNSFEASAAMLEPSSVIGRRFEEVAPCTQVRAFVQAARESLSTGEGDRIFRFIVPHHGGRCLVSVRLHGEPSARETWLFVSKRRGEAEAPVPPGLELPLNSPQTRRREDPRTSG